MDVAGQNTFALRVPGLTLRIVEVERNRSPDTSNPYDCWINCRVEIEVPNFQGAIHWSVLQNELRNLAADLETMGKRVGDESVVNFSPIEPGVILSFQMNGRGQIAAKYRFTDTSHGPGAPTLEGDFALDQTYLEPMAVGVRALLAG